MKKNLILVLTCLLIISLLAGCAGTTVVINECDCPGNEGSANVAAGVKTGMAVVTDASGSTPATEDANGSITFDVTVAAVILDENGVITACAIDSIPTNRAFVNFDTNGAIVSDVNADVPTKGELGEEYGMVAYGQAKAEWDVQVAALCEFAIGKTVEELKNGAVDETGKAPEGSDLASSATIYLGGYVSLIEAAANNAQVLGANADDELTLVTLNKLSSSTGATEEGDGVAQLDADIAVVTSKDGVITSCIIDAVQAQISFNMAGQIVTDLTIPIQTKNERGEAYGMVAYGQAKAEWNEQAAAFASYVTGKTADEVASIAVDPSTKPADGSDLAASVSIKIGGFQDLIAKALG